MEQLVVLPAGHLVLLVQFHEYPGVFGGSGEYRSVGVVLASQLALFPRASCVPARATPSSVRLVCRQGSDGGLMVVVMVLRRRRWHLWLDRLPTVLASPPACHRRRRRFGSVVPSLFPCRCVSVDPTDGHPLGRGADLFQRTLQNPDGFVNVVVDNR